MPEDPKLTRLFDSLNKNLYRTNKILELYKPVQEIISSLAQDIKELEDISEKEPLLNSIIEEEIKKRELISLYKKMLILIENINAEINDYEKKIAAGDVFLNNFRCYRLMIFENSKKSKEFIEKLIESFEISEFVLKFNVVGTIDLNNIAEHVKGRKVGIDIIVPATNINLIFDEVLKAQTMKFRLASESLLIYFEKDNILQLEAPSKKIKIADTIAKDFGAKLIDE
ncbi:MAG TPA: hypothetical protein P5530_01225 [Candidatus Diapherotrites archaeon]|nr:hypothetical protein [Candidatus Diapherotrites archaeon]